LIHKVTHPGAEPDNADLINTRGMSETWYQSLLNVAPDLAGALALHHGSIDMQLRNWVRRPCTRGS